MMRPCRAEAALGPTYTPALQLSSFTRTTIHFLLVRIESSIVCASFCSNSQATDLSSVWVLSFAGFYQWLMAAMAPSFVLAALTLLLSVSSMIAVGAATAEPTTSLWSAVFPSLPLPEPLRQAISPLEGSPTAARFASALARGAVFPSNSATFCSAAGLVCDENVKVTSYSLHGSRGANDVDTTPAPRAPSIKTINDFQFDFFLEDQLVEGGAMHLSENLHDPIPVRPFLPRVVADSLPSLTTNNLPKLRQTFNIRDKTPMSTMMGTASFLCENPALPGEEKDCPTTVAAMAQFVSSQLGFSVEALTTTGAPSTAPTRKAPVKIEAVTKRSLTEGDHIVICHGIMFPSALYYCHHVTGTKVVQASLRTDDGSLIQAVGICHLDTTLWASEHPAFKALNIPRGAEACHWSTQNDMVWVSTATQ